MSNPEVIEKQVGDMHFFLNYTLNIYKINHTLDNKIAPRISRNQYHINLFVDVVN